MKQNRRGHMHSPTARAGLKHERGGGFCLAGFRVWRMPIGARARGAHRPRGPRAALGNNFPASSEPGRRSRSAPDPKKSHPKQPDRPMPMRPKRAARPARTKQPPGLQNEPRPATARRTGNSQRQQPPPDEPPVRIGRRPRAPHPGAARRPAGRARPCSGRSDQASR
jgi:hypothetical protein